MAYKNKTTDTDLDFDNQLAKLFGVLEHEKPATPLGSVVRTRIDGFWEVIEYQQGGSFKCRCGRSDPFLFSKDQFRRYWPLKPENGCHLCQEALEGATTKAERLAAWLDSRRALINPEQHLELPDDCGHLYIKDSAESKSCAIIRTRHFVYTHFYRKPVPSGFCVKSTCRNDLCLNPHHLCLTKNRHSKLTPHTRELIGKLSSKGFSTQGIQHFLQKAHSLELSLRSIQRIVREARKSRSCVS